MRVRARARLDRSFIAFAVGELDLVREGDERMSDYMVGILVLIPIFVVIVWVSVVLINLFHEVGHARVAERHSKEVFVTASSPPCFLMPAFTGRVFGLERTDIWLGLWPYRGQCGHTPVTGTDNLIELYEAGYKATFKLALWALLFTLIFLGVGLVWGFTLLIDLGLLAFGVLTAASLLSTAGNKWCKAAANKEKGRHGSDAWHLKQLRKQKKTGESYTPSTTLTASAVRALANGRFLCKKLPTV